MQTKEKYAIFSKCKKGWKTDLKSLVVHTKLWVGRSLERQGLEKIFGQPKLCSNSSSGEPANQELGQTPKSRWLR